MLKPILSAALTLALLGQTALRAEESRLVFAPSSTAVHWTLNTVLHTVHGTFRLKEGSVSFDRATGKAWGEIVIDSQSGESGSSSRDSRMHSSILESTSFPRIVFRPDRVSGQIPTQGQAKLDVHGQFELHGKAHEFTLPVEVRVDSSQIAITSHFQVPYIQWGLKNPSTFILRVDDKVSIDLTASGVQAALATH